MIFLSKTSEELQLVTSSTANIDFAITVTDTPTSLGMYEVGDGKINTAGISPLLINTGAKHTKFFHLISIKNTDLAIPNTILVQKFTAAGIYEITPSVTLLPGEMYEYISGEGWIYYAADGTVKTSPIVLGGDKNFVIQQIIAATVWSVPHNLNKRVAVQVTDNSFNEIEAKVHWVDNNSVEITFNNARTGWVYCN